MTTPTNWPNPERPGVPFPLKGGGYCLVDEDKIEKISPYNWCKLKRAGNEYARAKVKIDGEWKVILMHRLLTDAPKGLVVDHINRNSLDNRIFNLRVCTQQQNTMNRLANKSNVSGHKGVTWDKERSKWLAQIKINQKKIFLGRFDSLEAAILHRSKVEIEMFGEFSPNEIRNLGAAP